MEDLRPITILLVEDDLGDQKLIKNSLLHQKIGGLGQNVVVVVSGSSVGLPLLLSIAQNQVI